MLIYKKIISFFVIAVFISNYFFTAPFGFAEEEAPGSEIVEEEAEPEPEQEPEIEEIVTEPVAEEEVEEVPEPEQEPKTEEIVAELESEVEPEPLWVMGEDGGATTARSVLLGETYQAQQNKGISVVFTALPDPSGTITVREIALSPEEREALGAVSDVAYEVTSTMEDGTFLYDLTLPLPPGISHSNAGVKYADDEESLDEARAVEQPKETSPSAITIRGLDHFTVFVVTADLLPLVGLACLDAGADAIDLCFTSINDAIAAASSGDTIIVGVGIYEEQLLIDKSIILKGAGAGTAGAARAGDNESVIEAPGTLVNVLGRPTLVTVSGAGVEVTLQGFTITGTGPGTCGSINAGIVVRDGAFADILENRILEIRDKPFSGCQNGQGIWVGRAADETSGRASIVDNLIASYQKGGIVIDNAGSTATTTGNVITGAGPTDIIAQNGIQVSRGAVATVSGNTVTGNDYTPTTDIATGILLFKAGVATVVGTNTVNGNEVGLWTSVEESLGQITLAGITGNGRNAVADYDGGFPGDPLNEYAAWTTPTEVLVDDSFTGTKDGNGGDIVSFGGVLGVITWNSFTAIQPAIAAVAASGTIEVAAGIYNEDVNVNKSITLTGNGAGTTTIQGQGIGEPGALVISADNVTIEGFNVIGSGVSAIRISGARASATITNNKAVAANGKNAFLTDGGQNNHAIKNNTFEGGASQLVYVNGTASVGSASLAVSFTGNTFAGSATGPALGLEADTSTVSNNTFTTATSYTLIENFGTNNTINSNNITNSNGGNGLISSVAVDAAKNWWGDPSGPAHPSNPAGIGDAISGDDVVFDPWFVNSGRTVLSNAVTNGTIDATAEDLDLGDGFSGSAGLPGGITEITLSDTTALNLASSVSSAVGDTLSIAGATTSLASFTSGTLTNVDLAVAQTIGGVSVTVKKGVRLSSGSSTKPTVIKNTALANATVSIPDATVILAPDGWDGKMSPPRSVPASGTPPAGFSIGSTTIEVGSPDVVLLFDKPVTLFLAGVTGTVGHKSSGSENWTQIAAVCGGTFDAPADPVFPGECAISNGTDTKIVTYHCTVFGGLEESSPPQTPSASRSRHFAAPLLSENPTAEVLSAGELQEIEKEIKRIQTGVLIVQVQYLRILMDHHAQGIYRN